LDCDAFLELYIQYFKLSMRISNERMQEGRKGLPMLPIFCTVEITCCLIHGVGECIIIRYHLGCGLSDVLSIPKCGQARYNYRRRCVVCKKIQQHYCPTCREAMCMGKCFVKHHSNILRDDFVKPISKPSRAGRRRTSRPA
jgi:hypothetical protein